MRNNKKGIKEVVENIGQEELRILLKKGGDLLSKGEIEKAKQTYEEALKIARKKGIVDGELICLYCIGDILYHQARAGETDCFSQATKFFDKASKIFKQEHGLKNLRYDFNWKSNALRELAAKNFFSLGIAHRFCGDRRLSDDAFRDLFLISFSPETARKRIGQELARSGIEKLDNSLLQEFKGSQWVSGEIGGREEE